MKKKIIIFLIYDEMIHLKINDTYFKVALESDVIMNGRINNIRKLVNNLKKSKVVFQSFFKLINDSFIMIYFSNYNNYELHNIINDFKENGIENIKLIDYATILGSDMNTSFLIFNDNYYYLTIDNKKLVIPELINISEYTNSKIIADRNSYSKITNGSEKARIYTIDDLPKYLLNKIC